MFLFFLLQSVSLLNPHAILDTVEVIGTNSLSYTGIEKIAFTLDCIFVSGMVFEDGYIWKSS
jgi:L-lysine exporter family protein LysE/ArgO